MMTIERATSSGSWRSPADRLGHAPVIATSEPQYSVVVPFFNEAESAAAVLSEIAGVMRQLAAGYEMVLVNDGSTDATRSILRAFADAHRECRLVDLRSNHGQAAALYAGLVRARAPILITMDGDGQNDPRDIPALLEQLRRADMVVGIRVDRRDRWSRRAMSQVANRLRQRILRDGMDDSGCALKAFKREVVGALLPIRTLYSFLPAMAVAGGFVVAQHPVAHRARTAGRSSYGLWRFLWRPILDTAGMWWFAQRSFQVRALRSQGAREGSAEATPPIE